MSSTWSTHHRTLCRIAPSSQCRQAAPSTAPTAGNRQGSPPAFPTGISNRGVPAPPGPSHNAAARRRPRPLPPAVRSLPRPLLGATPGEHRSGHSRSGEHGEQRSQQGSCQIQQPQTGLVVFHQLLHLDRRSRECRITTQHSHHEERPEYTLPRPELGDQHHEYPDQQAPAAVDDQRRPRPRGIVDNLAESVTAERSEDTTRRDSQRHDYRMLPELTSLPTVGHVHTRIDRPLVHPREPEHTSPTSAIWHDRDSWQLCGSSHYGIGGPHRRTVQPYPNGLKLHHRCCIRLACVSLGSRSEATPQVPLPARSSQAP